MPTSAVLPSSMPTSASATLRGADLSNATLFKCHPQLCHPQRCRPQWCRPRSGVDVGWTSFGDVDLSVVKNLETVLHLGPSSIGIDTIYRSQGKIPEVFLRGAGVPDSFLDYMHSLVGKPIDYYSCFISYSSKDDAFARRLYADFQSNHVRCWFAPEDLKIGDKSVLALMKRFACTISSYSFSRNPLSQAGGWSAR